MGTFTEMRFGIRSSVAKFEHFDAALLVKVDWGSYRMKKTMRRSRLSCIFMLSLLSALVPTFQNLLMLITMHKIYSSLRLLKEPKLDLALSAWRVVSATIR